MSLLIDAFRSVPDSLFHSREYLALRADLPTHVFEWAPKNEVVASIPFSKVGADDWRSPARGTFAGYWGADTLDPATLRDFHRASMDELRRRGARSVEILLPPERLAPSLVAAQVHCLLGDGFAIGQVDLDHCFAIDDRPFQQRMTYGNRKRIAKCAREGLAATALPIEALDDVYDVLRQNREARGYTLSMDLAALSALAAAVPDRMQLFGASAADSMLVAAALTLRVTADALYVFYWGDRPGWSRFSPVVLVAEAIHDWSRANGVRLIDAGTSTIGPELNEGLIAFKRGLGFSECLKLRMTKTFG